MCQSAACRARQPYAEVTSSSPSILIFRPSISRCFYFRPSKIRGVTRSAPLHAFRRNMCQCTACRARQPHAEVGIFTTPLIRYIRTPADIYYTPYPILTTLSDVYNAPKPILLMFHPRLPPQHVPVCRVPWEAAPHRGASDVYYTTTHVYYTVFAHTNRYLLHPISDVYAHRLIYASPIIQY